MSMMWTTSTSGKNALLGNIGSNLKQIANALDISIIEADKDDYSEKEYNGSLQRIDGA